MQLDFHHATTYVLARLAGFPHGEAAVIAHAAQYVDDATTSGVITFKGGRTFERIASAHPLNPFTADHVADVLANGNALANLETWTLFHFLPANGGHPTASDEPMEALFTCWPDSPVASAMWAHALEDRQAPHALHRLGITAHVYADTWAHQGFLGLCHERNRVLDLPEPGFSLEELRNNALSHLMAALPLGHGMALALPDLPWLWWSYVDWQGQTIRRDNTQLCLAACQRLATRFGEYRNRPVRLREEDMASLRTAFCTIQERDPEVRHASWLAFLRAGAFSFGPLSAAEADDLQYVAKGEGTWKQQALGTTRHDDADGPFTWTPAFETSHWKLFHEALKAHRETLLQEVFPAFALDPEALVGQPVP